VKQFFLKLLLLAPIPLLVIGLNWVIDPVHLKDAEQYERGIAQLILAGKNVTNIWNPDEEAYLKAYIDNLQQRKDVLILGSSRSKLIRSDSFPGLTFFNNSISGGGLIDYLAIYELYRQKNLTPSIVVLELSPWLLNRDYASIWEAFNAHRKELEQQVLHPELNLGQPIQIGRSASTDWAEFLSPGYFQTSFYSWLRGTIKPAENKSAYFEYQDGDLPVGETIRSDGSAIYPERVQNTTEAGQITAQAIEYARNPAGVPETLDPGRQQVLEGFIDYLRRQGVQVIFYLPPYHPKAYELMANSERYKIIVDAQKYYEDLAQRKNITLVGSYDPADLALDSTAFFDASHPTQDAVKAIFAGHIPNAQQTVSTPTADEIKVVGVSNQNGLEVVNNKPFFWIGQGPTCLSVRSTRAGTAILVLTARPGPSVSNTMERHLLVNMVNGYSATLTINEYPNVQIPIPVQRGLNDACLVPLDKPTELELPNGDRRPLLLGVSDVRAQFSTQPIASLSDSCQLIFTDGWHQLERTETNWRRWSNGNAALKVLVGADTTATLSGELNSIQRPNQVDIVVNGNLVTTLKTDWEEWAFKSFPPLTFALKTGPNVIEFRSHNLPITQTNDLRPLAIAVKDLHLELSGNRPCEIQP
jgi:hypothetical protein